MKKGRSRSSSTTPRGKKAGSGKTKPAFAFDKTSKDKASTRSTGTRDAKSNFKKRSEGGFTDKKRNSSAAGFDKTEKSIGRSRTGTEKKTGGLHKEEKNRNTFGKGASKPRYDRAPKSFGRNARKDNDDVHEVSGFNEDEFFGRVSQEPKGKDPKGNKKTTSPARKSAAGRPKEGLSKRAEKAMVRRKVDKDFIDIKFSREQKKTDSIHRELNVKKVKNKNLPKAEEGVRLNRYLSNAGVASRREADALIQEGLVKINGKVVTELGTKVMPGDSVKYGNKIISPEKPVYVLLNKPKDFITTTDDPQERKTVMALVANACKERIVPVGRLDRNTTGLLLFTNDGDLAQKLTHPSSNIKKIYLVELDKPIAEKDFETIKNGKLRLFDGPVKVDDLAVTDHTRKVLGIEIHEGRNRIVRRIFEELGYEVQKLDRVMYAGLTKKDLSRGKWRFLTAQEVNRLKYLE